MWGFGSRVVIGLAAFGIGVVGIVVAAAPAPFPETAAVLTSAVATTCPDVGDYVAPAPGSTGLPPGLVLCPSGPVTVTQPGAVLDGWDLRGGIVVDALGVVVRRSRITGDGVTPYGVRTTPAGTVRVEDTTLVGDFPQAAIGEERWTAERIAIVGVSHDGARLGDGARLRNSRVADFAPAAGAAGNALVVHGDDVRVEDNRVEPGPVAGSAVRVVSPVRDGPAGDGPVVISGNVLGGGGYTVHQDPDGPAGMPAEVRITDNRFRPDAARGPLQVSAAAVLDDNTFVDGRPLPS